MENQLYSLKNTARLAGLYYLLWILTGIFDLAFITPQTIVSGDPVATANKILANEYIFRIGIINGLFSSLLWVLIGMTLYRLFREVNERHAKLMVAFVLVQVPAVFVMEALRITSLKLILGEILKTFEVMHQQDLALLFLKISDYITIGLEMYWGLWLFPLGLLVLRSGFIPRILGIFLLLNAMAYVIHCLMHLLFPDIQSLVFTIVTPFWIVGEISIMLWLLIKGVRE